MRRPFCSTKASRSSPRKWRRVGEDALALHVMDANGANIHQISFNQSHDMDPSVLADGRIVYARWDNAAQQDAFNLYTMNPDGTEERILYGMHSHDTGPNGETVQFVEPQELPDGRVLVSMRPSTQESHLGAALVAIDTANYVEHDVPTNANQGLTADAQELLVPGDDRSRRSAPSPRGRFASVTPLYDGSDRLLVTWSQCRLLDPASPDPLNPIIVPCTAALLAMPDIQEAPPLYGVWMFDVSRRHATTARHAAGRDSRTPKRRSWKPERRRLCASIKSLGSISIRTWYRRASAKYTSTASTTSMEPQRHRSRRCAIPV